MPQQEAVPVLAARARDEGEAWPAALPQSR